MDFSDFMNADTTTEFVGTAVLDTIGLVISGVDGELLKASGLDTQYHALGLISSRAGASGQIIAVDDAVKATNTEIVTIELPRDSKGYAGHGNYIVVAGQDVADVKHAVKLSLELLDQKYAGGLYVNEAGHIELAYTASAGDAVVKAFGSQKYQAAGFLAGSPAAIGMVMADVAVKAASVEISMFHSPDHGKGHTNEVLIAVKGDASAVLTAVKAARDSGVDLLSKMGSVPKTFIEPYF